MKVAEVTTPRLRHSIAEAGAGGAGEPLLLLHGFTGAKEDFADFVDGFADRGWHVVAPDQRGHGASDQPSAESDYSLRIYADDVWALVDELGWDSFHLLGHSMGGMIAQVIALDAPERIRSLVLMDTSPGAVEGVDPDVAALALAVVRDEGMDRLAELYATVDLGPPAPSDARVRADRPGYVEFGDRKLRSSSAAMYAAMATELLDADDRADLLAGLDLGTLVVVGDEDVDFVGPSERLAAAIPGAELVVIPDAAHSPQFENPDRWWKDVSGFLGAGVAAP